MKGSNFGPMEILFPDIELECEIKNLIKKKKVLNLINVQLIFLIHF